MELKVIIVLINAWYGGPYLGISGAKVLSCTQTVFLVIKSYLSDLWNYIHHISLLCYLVPLLPHSREILGYREERFVLRHLHHLSLYCIYWQVTKGPGRPS